MDVFGYHQQLLLLTNLDKNCGGPKSTCYNITTKFLPLLGVPRSTYFSSNRARLLVNHEASESTSLVCAKRGLAGIGMLTDHGMNKHGQLMDDYEAPYNNGRGVTFWRFRNYMLSQMGLLMRAPARTSPYRVTFSINSSTNPSRRRDFGQQVEMFQKQLQSFPNVQVQTVVLSELSLAQQITVVQESSVFISVIGGAASTAMFLQRNSCLILYYNDMDDFVRGSQGDKATMPSMLDWDFWNNASYLRVHWLPMKSMDSNEDLGLFWKLIQSELEALPFYV
jgi:hypothetical protein